MSSDDDLTDPTSMADITIAQNIYRIFQQNYDVVHDQLVASYKDLALKVNDQNSLIETEIQQKIEGHSTDFRKSDYENMDTVNLKKIYVYIFWIYYIILAAFSIYVLFYINYSYLIKFSIVIIFGFLPWILHYGEKIIYNIAMWLYSIATSKIYSNVYMN